MPHRLLVVSLLLMVVCGCTRNLSSSCSSTTYANSSQEDGPLVCRYPLNFDKRTDLGTWVDTSGAVIDLGLIDDMTLEVANCLGALIEPCALRIKIAPDTTFAPNGQQTFPCSGGGLCTGQVQYPAVIVLTPNLISYRRMLVYNITHKEYGDPVFRCEIPYQAPPLSGGEVLIGY